MSGASVAIVTCDRPDSLVFTAGLGLNNLGQGLGGVRAGREASKGLSHGSLGASLTFRLVVKVEQFVGAGYLEGGQVEVPGTGEIVGGACAGSSGPPSHIQAPFTAPSYALSG